MSTNSDNLKDYKIKALKEFNQQQSLIQERAKNLHAQYVKPTIESVVKHSKQRPLAALLTSVFLAFSFIPILSFLFFSVTTLVIIFGTALLWSSIIIGGATIALVLTLSVTMFLAIGGSFWTLVGYEVYRLSYCLVHSRNLVEGLQTFEIEVRSLFLGSVQQIQNDTSQAGSAVREGIHSGAATIAPTNGASKVE